MYAHQVISDLEKTLKIPTLTDMLYREGVKLLIDNIKNAQHFYLGDFQDLKQPLKTTLTEDCQLFMNESSQFARLPYKKCWFEFDNKKVDVPLEEDVPKRGMLVIELAEDLIWVWIVNYVKAMGMWSLSPQQYYITIGKTLVENEAVFKLIKAFHAKDNNQKPLEESIGNSNVFPMPISVHLNAKTRISLAHDDNRDLYVLNSALLLLNCKNIETVEVKPPEKLNKKRRKNGKQEIFVYKTLRLSLPATKKEHSKNSENLEEANRIHLCRGHFKIYTEINPLFGKYTGIYWWQPHIRGSKSEGIIEKDYHIKT